MKKNSKNNFLLKKLNISVIFFALMTTNVMATPPDGFNDYILRAVDKLNAEYPSKGYDIGKAYTHPIYYADGTIKPSAAPLTMCVAAMAEAIATAINLYVEDTKDQLPYQYLPVENWNRMRYKDLRSHIWGDSKLDSFGTADALVTFGMGTRVEFKDLEPGSFININRNRPGKKPSGHAVIFISYLDDHGTELKTYSDKAVGFKYWSAQGKGLTGDSGFAYRYAFLNRMPSNIGYCPNLGPNKKVDCWIMNSRSSKYLNMGYMFKPTFWRADQRNDNLAKIAKGLYEQTRSKGLNAIPGLPIDVEYGDFLRSIEETDTMFLNSKYLADAATE